jgi:hypothetical protein
VEQLSLDFRSEGCSTFFLQKVQDEFFAIFIISRRTGLKTSSRTELNVVQLLLRFTIHDNNGKRMLQVDGQHVVRLLVSLYQQIGGNGYYN